MCRRSPPALRRGGLSVPRVQRRSRGESRSGWAGRERVLNTPVSGIVRSPRGWVCKTVRSARSSQVSKITSSPGSMRWSAVAKAASISTTRRARPRTPGWERRRVRAGSSGRRRSGAPRTSRVRPCRLRVSHEMKATPDPPCPSLPHRTTAATASGTDEHVAVVLVGDQSSSNPEPIPTIELRVAYGRLRRLSSRPMESGGGMMRVTVAGIDCERARPKSFWVLVSQSAKGEDSTQEGGR